jgi:transporter family-2 protein
MDTNSTHLIFMSLVALLAGSCVGLSRILNSSIAQVFGPIPSSIINHLVGFIFLLLVIGSFIGFQKIPQLSSIPLYALAGGAFGVVFVALNNFLVPKIGIAQTTILVTAGQMMGSYILDLLIRNESFSWIKILGVVLVGAGAAFSKKNHK